jgi:membrane-associated protease RseP (regulator of RpoE activity)
MDWQVPTWAIFMRSKIIWLTTVRCQTFDSLPFAQIFSRELRTFSIGMGFLSTRFMSPTVFGIIKPHDAHVS